ncbi:hypothetical protein BZG36_02979 [Bifiguratus adelaidae]|uniref:Afadin and alpha-actinin-binding-domain-containing protein n=1 Tax=Bifiguratus adelaidae TaxID=1938954 RepID=A0A261XYG2_9FUNG|nr:hypothetical protein BZG36_02979 [Bifiguratus adelaidae]
MAADGDVISPIRPNPSTPYQRQTFQISSAITPPYEFATPKKERFCNLDNLKSSSEFINSKLSDEGLPSPLQFWNGTHEDAVRIVNCIAKLLEQNQNDANARTDIEEKFQLLVNDYDTAQSNVARLKLKTDALERENHTLSVRLRVAEKESKQANSQLKLVKEELARLKANSQHAKTQFLHEQRRQEANLQKHREKLQRLLGDAYRGQKIIAELRNLPSAPELRGGSAAELDEEIKNQANQREALFRKENLALRGMLHELAQALVSKVLLYETNDDGQPFNVDHLHVDQPGQMFPDLQVLQSTIKQLVAQIDYESNERRQSGFQLATQMQEDHLNAVEQEVNDNYDVVEEQRKMIDDLKAAVEKLSGDLAEKSKLVEHFLENDLQVGNHSTDQISEAPASHPSADDAPPTPVTRELATPRVSKLPRPAHPVPSTPAWVSSQDANKHLATPSAPSKLVQHPDQDAFASTPGLSEIGTPSVANPQKRARVL